MQLLALAFGRVMAWVGAGIVAKILLSLGIGVVTYIGVDALLTYAGTQIAAQFAAVPPQLAQVLATMHVDDAVKIVLSACAVRLLMSSGKRLVATGPA